MFTPASAPLELAQLRGCASACTPRCWSCVGVCVSSLTLQYINIELRAPARFRPARPRDSSGALYQGFALVTGVRSGTGFMLRGFLAARVGREPWAEEEEGAGGEGRDRGRKRGVKEERREKR